MDVYEKTEQLLIDQISPLKQRQTELQKELAGMDRALRPLEVSLKALRSEVAKARAKEQKQGQRNAKKADILPVLKGLVGDNPGVPEDDLVALASERLLGALGFSNKGLGSNLKRCLKDEAFCIDSNRCVWSRDESPATADTEEATIRSVPN